MGLWSRIKRAVKRIVKAIVSSVFETVSRILRIPNAIATYFAFLPIKTVKFRVLILRDNDRSEVASHAEVQPLIDVAKNILRRSARIKLAPTSGEFIWTINEFGNEVPDEALRLNGPGTGIIGDQFGTAGEFFDDMISKYHSEATFPFNWPTMPLTCFIVKSIDDVRGIASPIVGNWFAVAASGLAPTINTGDDVGEPVYPSIMAHEIGHCLGLIAHSDTVGNLMHAPDDRGFELTQWQLVFARNSRCVSFW